MEDRKERGRDKEEDPASSLLAEEGVTTAPAATIA